MQAMNSNPKMPHQPSCDSSAEVRSGVRRTQLMSLLEAALPAHSINRDMFRSIVNDSLARAKLPAVPQDIPGLRAFVGHILAAEVHERLGPDATRAMLARIEARIRILEVRADHAFTSLKREQLADIDANADIPAVVYVLADHPAIAARIRMLFDERAEVLRARSLEDVLRASALRAGWRSTVLIDLRPGNRLGVPTSETLVRVLERMRAVVWADHVAIAEIRNRAATDGRIVTCGPEVRPENVALLIEHELHQEQQTLS
jgi:hypothetical protein